MVRVNICPRQCLHILHAVSESNTQLKVLINSSSRNTNISFNFIWGSTYLIIETLSPIQQQKPICRLQKYNTFIREFTYLFSYVQAHSSKVLISFSSHNVHYNITYTFVSVTEKLGRYEFWFHQYIT